jgi:hypothetical protein
MTLTFTIKGLQESLSAIEQYKEATNPEEIASSMRAGVRDLVVDHFATVNAQRANKLGGTPRTSHWEQHQHIVPNRWLSPPRHGRPAHQTQRENQ